MTTAASNNNLAAYSSAGLRTTADVVKPNTSDPHAKKTDFLVLMTAQIKHQNPLNPLEGKDFLAQLAQFSVVEGVEKLNTSFGDLSSNLVSDQSLQAASLIGHKVRVSSSRGYLDAEGTLQGAAALNNPASSLKVSIYNAGGQLVRELDLGAQSAGDIAFNWDGLDAKGARAPAGIYKVSANAQTAEGNTALATSLDIKVDGVTMGGTGGLTLDLAGGGVVSYADIQSIR